MTSLSFYLFFLTPPPISFVAKYEGETQIGFVCIIVTPGEVQLTFVT